MKNQRKKAVAIVLALAGMTLVAALLILNIKSPAGDTAAGEEVICRVPRVLIITTGKDGTGALPEGVILTMESFLRQGAYTRLGTRDALLDKDYLAQFNILVMLTAINYHDADRLYSLTFMDDLELNILRRWIHDGGMLIAGDNLGRNLRNGTDRISMYGRLEPENWPLAEPFGVMMSERNMEGFSLYGNLADSLNGMLIPPLAEGAWILVPDSLTGESAEVLASWQNDSLSFPALLFNEYGKGATFLLPSSYLLHPSNEGGHWNAVQINAFCEIILDKYNRNTPIRFRLMPWPDGSPAAFAVSLNSDGDAHNYNRVFSLLRRKGIAPTLFVNNTLDKAIISILEKFPHRIQSNGFRKVNMQNLSFSETVFQIEMNEQAWNQSFSGFRFPFTLNSVAGMEFLQRKGYIYDSSIGKERSTTFSGSLFPYHLPVFQGETYRVLDLIEISPLARDDYFYYRMIQDDGETADMGKLAHKAQLFADYLHHFWTHNTPRNGGMMVFLGHPLFTGYNDTVVQPLGAIIDTARAAGAWITSMEEIARRWQLLDKTLFHITSGDRGKKQCTIHTLMPEGEQLDMATITVSRKPEKVRAAYGKVSVQEARNNTWQIIFDAFNGQRVEVTF